MYQEISYSEFSHLVRLMFEHEQNGAPRHLVSSQFISNEVESSRRIKKKHASVQTIPEVETTYFPWLLEIERKTEEFCTELNNLLNSFHNSFREESKRIVCSQCSRSMQESDKYRKKYPISEFGNNVKHIDYPTKTCNNGGTSKIQAITMLKKIENVLKSVLESATQIRNSIPVVDFGKVAEEIQPSSSSREKKEVSFNSQKLGNAYQQNFQAQRSQTAPPPAVNKGILKKNINREKTVASGIRSRPKNFTLGRTNRPENIPPVHKQNLKATKEKTPNNPTESGKAKNQRAIPKRPINQIIPKSKVGEPAKKANPIKNQKPRWR